MKSVRFSIMHPTNPPDHNVAPQSLSTVCELQLYYFNVNVEFVRQFEVVMKTIPNVVHVVPVIL